MGIGGIIPGRNNLFYAFMKRIFLALLVLGCLGKVVAQTRPSADSVEWLRQEDARMAHIVDSLRTIADKRFNIFQQKEDSLKVLQRSNPEPKKLTAMTLRHNAAEKHLDDILTELDRCVGELNELNYRLKAALSARKKQ